MAPRGVVAAAVTAIFALRLESEGFAGAERLVPIVFLMIAGTVAIYGLIGRPLAIRLGLAQRNPSGLLLIGAQGFARALARTLQRLGVPVMLVDTNAELIGAARMDGLRVYHGSVLSDQADEELELGGIGKLLAMTANDEVNALSARHFVHLFGRQNLFQLAPAKKKVTEGSAELGSEVRARVLFGEEVTYSELQRRYREGQRYKATPMTEQFGIEDWYSEHGPDALPLLVVSEGGAVSVGTRDQGLEPRPGDTLVGLARVAPVHAKTAAPN
jgi:CPA1 family monovalent cation:H+ antiporter